MTKDNSELIVWNFAVGGQSMGQYPANSVITADDCVSSNKQHRIIFDDITAATPQGTCELCNRRLAPNPGDISDYLESRLPPVPGTGDSIGEAHDWY